MVHPLFDVYLWAQVGKISLYITYVSIFVVAEKVLRSILYIASFFVPMAVLDWLRARVTSVPRLFRGFKDEEDPKELNYDTPELITSRGYLFEEHYAETADGFRLAMHRIPPRTLRRSEAGAIIPAPVVYVMHGFLQSSECFVANERGLGFELAAAGCDVWLGNCRGNKYSCKHATHSPHSNEYWDFCMDDVAKHDVPTCLNYILTLTDANNASAAAAAAVAARNTTTTHQATAAGVAEVDCKTTAATDAIAKAIGLTSAAATASIAQPSKITYIGFSQGTAVAFACFSQNPSLAARVNLFVALAPATLAVGFNNKLLDSLAKISPDLVYLMFGRTALLSTTLFWQNLLSTKLFCVAIERSCEFLFGWDMANVAKEDKALLYSHIYSYSSVKSVVHWFQLMRSKRFQVYDDAKWKGPQASYQYQGRRVPGYPINQITCPIAIFYGGRDFLVDTPSLLRDLPKSTIVHEESSYEHLDFMMAASAKERVYPKIISLIYSRHPSTATSASAAASNPTATPPSATTPSPRALSVSGSGSGTAAGTTASSTPDRSNTNSVASTNGPAPITGATASAVVSDVSSPVLVDRTLVAGELPPIASEPLKPKARRPNNKSNRSALAAGGDSKS